MNERIKELATQATRQYSPTYYTQEWIQGFAELIVRECAEVCRLKYAYSDELSKGVSINFSDAVKEHFGVEE